MGVGSRGGCFLKIMGFLFFLVVSEETGFCFGLGSIICLDCLVGFVVSLEAFWSRGFRSLMGLVGFLEDFNVSAIAFFLNILFQMGVVFLFVISISFLNFLIVKLPSGW